MLLYKHNQSRDGRKKKRKYFCFNQNFLKKVLIAVASSPGALCGMMAQ